MDLASQIYVRKSCRNYLDDEIDMSEIQKFISNVNPLDESIRYHYKIFKKDEVNIKTRWRAPYYLALYSENNEMSGVNIGFVFQQVSLYLQSIGIGSCWVGMGSLKEKDSEFVILIAFGKSDRMTRDRADFKRKSLSDISDFEDEKLIPAQLAPSAINSQPWYFKHTEDGFDVYQQKQNILKRQILKKWNPIDVGIALAHLYVENMDMFSFEVKNSYDEMKGYTYIGSIKI
ncbi:MAG: hypothetical protein IJ287_05790 [Methanobrevibacter sp.]|nr:hypothetical protein [Methanobrevibacter sp.]